MTGQSTSDSLNCRENLLHLNDLYIYLCTMSFIGPIGYWLYSRSVEQFLQIEPLSIKQMIERSTDEL